MAPPKERAYRLILSAALLHVKWDLACLFGGFSWFRPRTLYRQLQSCRRAAFRASAFHNLAILSTYGFADFSEERFWSDIDSFRANCPGPDWADYRAMFERVLAGEEVHVIAPGGQP